VLLRKDETRCLFVAVFRGQGVKAFCLVRVFARSPPLADDVAISTPIHKNSGEIASSFSGKDSQ